MSPIDFVSIDEGIVRDARREFQCGRSSESNRSNITSSWWVVENARLCILVVGGRVDGC